MPARELADAALVLVGGTLLLIPGFVTDVVGLLLLLPPTRARRRRAARRLGRLRERSPVGAGPSTATARR